MIGVIMDGLAKQATITVFKFSRKLAFVSSFWLDSGLMRACGDGALISGQVNSPKKRPRKHLSSLTRIKN
jgi:hypothetical protein